MNEPTPQLGKYRILELIGKGGFAEVYRAQDTILGREVALKILFPRLLNDWSFENAFHHEARTLARLRHPAIIVVYEVGEIEGRFFIAMDLINGPDLAEAINQHGRLSWATTLELLKLIAEGLDYAHSQQVVHRDLKPSNILLHPQHGPLISDFGLASMMSQNQASVHRSGAIIGTPHYIAPEIWDSNPATPAADIYALGCIVYEMLTGKILFQGPTPMQVMRAHDQGARFVEPWPDDVPPGVDAVLRQALAREPQDRYQSATDLWHALKEVDQALPVAAGPPATRASPQFTRVFALFIVALVLALGLVAAQRLLPLSQSQAQTDAPTVAATNGPLPSATAASSAGLPTGPATATPTDLPTPTVTQPPNTPVPTTVPTAAATAAPATAAPEATVAPATSTPAPPTPRPATATPQPRTPTATRTAVPPTQTPQPVAANPEVVTGGSGALFRGSVNLGEIAASLGQGGSCIEGRVSSADGGKFSNFGVLVDIRGSSRDPSYDFLNGTYRLCGLSAGEWGVAVYKAGGVDVPGSEQVAHQVRVRLTGTPGEIAYINFRAQPGFAAAPPTNTPVTGPYDGIWNGTLSGTTTTGSFTGRFRMEVRANAVYRISIDGPSCLFETYPNFPNGQGIGGGSFATGGRPYNPQAGTDDTIEYNVSGAFSSTSQASGSLYAKQNGSDCAVANWSASR
ncbi:MAG: hypothetical protein OHK0022_21420 [Roseiflexaceae bacterium]